MQQLLQLHVSGPFFDRVLFGTSLLHSCNIMSKTFQQLATACHLVDVNTSGYVPYNLPYKKRQRVFYIA